MSAYHIEITELAEQDISEAYEWYQNQKEGFGSVFQADFLDAIETIKINPEKFQIRYLRVRIHFLDKFPYGIHYTVQEKTVIILAVFHTSRNPKKWIKRAGKK